MKVPLPRDESLLFPMTVYSSTASDDMTFVIYLEENIPYCHSKTILRRQGTLLREV